MNDNSLYPLPPEFTEVEFALFKKYIYDVVGIDLADHKSDLLRNRLKRRLPLLGVKNFTEYYEYIRRNKDELSFFVSAITTNVTSFFREPKQWEYLRSNLMEYITKKGDKTLNIWSAGCATGEEPYTISIFLHELFGRSLSDYRISILATDISDGALTRAKAGSYSKKQMVGLSADQIQKSFNIDPENSIYTIKDEYKKIITYKPFNLVYGDFSKLPEHGQKFDLIFCRNVMIYFDTEVKHKLISRYLTQLMPEGYIFVGHSESLMSFASGLTPLLYGIYKKKL